MILCRSLQKDDTALTAELMTFGCLSVTSLTTHKQPIDQCVNLELKVLVNGLSAVHPAVVLNHFKGI